MRSLWEAVWRHPARGLAASLVLHIAAIALVLMTAVPSTRPVVKRGEPLMVEFPDLKEPPPAGNPAAKTVGAPVRQPRLAPRAPAPAPRIAAAPPAPVVKPEPERPVEPPRVASQPPPAPATPPPPVPPAPPTPQVAEPTLPSPPVAETPPAPPAPPVAPAPVEPPKPVPAVATAPEPTPQPSAPPAPVAAEPAPRVPPQIAAVTPAPVPTPEPPPIDIRSALGRGGGAGSARGGGRGGIEGEPIPLDSTDAKFSDYLDRLRRRIKANWGFPCIRSATGPCDYKTTSLIVEFGILKDGRLQFVDVVKSSGFPIYDDYAVNAIKLGSPFPAVPPEMIVSMKRGSTGVAIMARFNYVVDTSLTNLLR
jgi:TonB family protein